MTTTGRARILWATCLAAALATTVSATRAEVSVTVEPGRRPAALKFAAIVDGPDPVPFFWFRISSNSNDLVLNETGDLNGDGPPTIVGNPAGVCMVAWAKHTPTGYDIVGSRFENDAWTTPEVLAGSSVDELDPVLLQAQDGLIHLFYWEAATVPRILHRTAPADLSSWSAPVEVSQAGEASCRPQAIFHEGVLRIVYEVHDYGYGQTPRQIVVSRFENGEFVREVVAITHNVDPIWPEIHSGSGKLWIDWEDSPGQMFWKRRDPASGIWEPAQVEPYTNQLQQNFFVRGTIEHLALE